MRTSIKRLVEADDIQQLPMMNQMPANGAQMTPPEPAQSPEEMMPDFSFQEEPEMDQQALPQPDVMNLTVKELIDRCDKVNPLICMGLKQFIDSNQEALLDQTTGEAPDETANISMDDTDINFSQQVEPKSPEFSLDQPAELDFPQE